MRKKRLKWRLWAGAAVAIFVLFQTVKNNPGFETAHQAALHTPRTAAIQQNQAENSPLNQSSFRTNTLNNSQFSSGISSAFTAQSGRSHTRTGRS